MVIKGHPGDSPQAISDLGGYLLLKPHRSGRSGRPAGSGVVGVYVPSDPQAASESAQQGRIGFDYGTFFQKGQQMGTGQCPVKRYNDRLRDLMIAGQATPSLPVSHELSLDEASAAYEKFDQRADGYTKVLLHPAQRTSWRRTWR